MPLVDPGARGSTRLAGPLELRAGARYLGDRVTLEVVGEVTFYPGGAERENWEIHGVAVRDDSGVTQSLGSVPALAAQRTRGGVRAALDIELLSGFLWLTAGYAYQTGPVSGQYLTPTLLGLESHTLAAGLDASWGELSVTLGYARSFSSTKSVTGTAVDIVNPFGAGTGPAATGTYRDSDGVFGMIVEASWGGKE
jgi:hypothetical protein